MTRSATDPIAATGVVDRFGDRFPTQPIAIGRSQPRPVHGNHHRRAPRAARSTGPIVAVVVIAVVTGALGLQHWAASSRSATPDVPTPSAPVTAPEPPVASAPQAGDVPRSPPPLGPDDLRGDRSGALGEADGIVPDGVTVFDDDVPAVANLDPDLLDALRRAATDAADDRVEFSVNSGWRSPAYQDQLLREAISEYGSEEEAARWVSTAQTSLHVSGDAVDIGPTRATTWLAENGAEHGLCQIYRNEPWHYELRPDAVDDGCPALYADPTHDPRMQK